MLKHLKGDLRPDTQQHNTSGSWSLWVATAKAKYIKKHLDPPPPTQISNEAAILFCVAFVYIKAVKVKALLTS